MSKSPAVLLACLTVIFLPGIASATRATAVTGREVLTGRYQAREWRKEIRNTGWSVGIVGGISAGGDLLRAVTEQTATWQAPAGGGFHAQRLTVTLDEDLLLGLSLSRRLTTLGSLRLSGSWTEMDATALANDTQFVHPVLFDRLTILRFGLLWEQRLLATRLAPYLLVGGSYLDIDAAAPAFRQQVLAPCWGVGVRKSLDRFWSLRVEMIDAVRQLDTQELATEEGVPPSAEIIQLGPQHLVELVAGVTLDL